MRVLHVIPSLSAVHGGPSQAIRTMEQALRAQGIDVEIATTDDDGPGRRVARPLGTRVEEEGGRRWYFSRSTEFYKCSWPFARWIVRHVRDYDVVHVHALFSFTPVVAAWAARRAGVPYVVRPLGTLGGYGRLKRRPILKKWSLRWLDGPLLGAAAAVHFTSVEEQRESGSLGLPIRSAVVPLGLAVEDHPAARPLAELLPPVAGKQVVAFMSRLDPIKNVEGLLGGFHQVLDEFPQAHLVLAGSGAPDYVEVLRAQASNLLGEARVTWLGHVHGEMKAALLQGASVFVLPSHSESFGIALAEALAAGVPCVVGTRVALAEQVKTFGAGVCVDVDAASIAAGLRSILGSEERRVAMAERARALAVAELSSVVMGNKLRSLYQSILDERAP